MAPPADLLGARGRAARRHPARDPVRAHDAARLLLPRRPRSAPARRHRPRRPRGDLTGLGPGRRPSTHSRLSLDDLRRPRPAGGARRAGAPPAPRLGGGAHPGRRRDARARRRRPDPHGRDRLRARELRRGPRARVRAPLRGRRRRPGRRRPLDAVDGLAPARGAASRCCPATEEPSTARSTSRACSTGGRTPCCAGAGAGTGSTGARPSISTHACASSGSAPRSSRSRRRSSSARTRTSGAGPTRRSALYDLLPGTRHALSAGDPFSWLDRTLTPIPPRNQGTNR